MVASSVACTANTPSETDTTESTSDIERPLVEWNVEHDTDMPSYTFPDRDCSGSPYVPPNEDTDQSNDTVECNSSDHADDTNCVVENQICVEPDNFSVQAAPTNTVELLVEAIVRSTDEHWFVRDTTEGRFVLRGVDDEDTDTFVITAFDLCYGEVIGAMTATHTPNPTHPECPLGTWQGPSFLVNDVLTIARTLHNDRERCYGVNTTNSEDNCECQINEWIYDLQDVCL